MKKDRREFINTCFRFAAGASIVGVAGVLAANSQKGDYVWQLDPAKCTQCGRCASSCVITPSAVKCIHVYDMCGYCDLCGGYFRPNVKDLSTAAENQLCPTGAIKRTYVEDPYFKYEIIDELCIGCGKCVKGCGAFGNGSLQLQINHDICVNCNQCAIAVDCPADAFSRVPIEEAYRFSGFTSNKKNK